MPDISVPPCMPLVLFKVLPWCWSQEGVSLSKSMCGPPKRRRLGIPQFLPPAQPPLVFTVRSYGDLPSWHWNPGLGGLVRGWDPSLPRYPFILYPPPVDLGLADSISLFLPHHCPFTPLTHLDECGFFNSLLFSLPYTSIF